MLSTNQYYCYLLQFYEWAVFTCCYLSLCLFLSFSHFLIWFLFSWCSYLKLLPYLYNVLVKIKAFIYKGRFGLVLDRVCLADCIANLTADITLLKINETKTELIGGSNVCICLSIKMAVIRRKHYLAPFFNKSHLHCTLSHVYKNVSSFFSRYLHIRHLYFPIMS